MGRILKVMLFFLFVSTTAYSQLDAFHDIQAHLRTGDAVELAKCFNNTVECDILGTESMYSRSQAVLVFKDFFAKYKPKTFLIQQTKSQRNGSRYAIGAYAAQSGEIFRVIIYAKDIRENVLVYQLKIEKY